MMALLHFLKTTREARKIFGKRELKIIEKQLLGVRLTQSEKNRVSRDIRKKFSFIAAVAKFSDEFRLKKGDEVKRIIKEGKEVIARDRTCAKIKEIILFGSAAENTLTLQSDIDLVVKFVNINKREATAFRQRISGRVHSRIDVQVYNHLPEKIRKEIDKKGRVIT